MLEKSFFLKLLVVGIALVSTTQARWATYEDAPFEIMFHNEDIQVNADGTTITTIEIQKKILKEGGRSLAAGYTVTYNGDSTKATIVEAKTLYQGKVYKLSKKMIEDKPLASAPQGFDQQRQILLSFPHAEIGATIYLKYTVKVLKPNLDNFFSRRIYYGANSYLRSSRLTLKSKLPLHIRVNDPENALKVTKDAEDNFHHLTIDLTKPICNTVVSESEVSVLNPRHKTWISISSLNKWEDLATRLAEGYTKVIDQPLPEVFEEIASQAKDKTTEVEQINTVTSLLNEKIQYMGDWRSVAGRLYPRALKEIAKSQLGDCKDFSASVAAILKKLGYEVQSAAVLRGIDEISFEGLPDIGDFNHAFLKVTSKQGKVYWIDPTNRTSMAQGIYPDIAGKMALVMSADKPGYEKVAHINYELSRLIRNNELDIKGNKVSESGSLVLERESAEPLTGLAFWTSAQHIRDSLFYGLSGVHLEEKNKISLEMPDLISRTVKDLTFKYKYEQDNRVVKTNLGLGLKINLRWIDGVISAAPDQVSDLFLGAPFTFHNTTTLKTGVPNVEKLNYETDTPWLFVKRSCVYKEGNTEITHIVVFKQTFITREELQTQAYKNLKESLEQNFKDTILILGETSQSPGENKG